MFYGQKIFPAARNMKQLEKLLLSRYQCVILLDVHIAQLKSITRLMEKHNKKLWLHADLIHGLKHDEYAAEFLCQEYNVSGLISTRSQVIATAKKKKILAIQRMFLLDNGSLETGYKIAEKYQPDAIEVLPGIIPAMITEVKEKFAIPVLAGGLLRKISDIEQAMQAGAVGVTTSNEELLF